MIRLGVVARPHGLRGQVAVQVDLPGSRTLLDVAHVSLAPADEPGRARRYPVREAAPGRKGQILLSLAEVTTPEAAEALRGLVVLVEPSQLPPLEPDEYFVRDLLGLQAVDEQGRSLGAVTDVVDTAEVPVLVVGEGAAERFVPFTRSHVIAVEPKAGRVVVRPPDELT